MAHKADLIFLKNRAKAFGDTGAWLLILVGVLLFASRLTFTPTGFVNLPVVVTILQTAGLMFAIAGLQIMISRLVWPGISVTKLITQAGDGAGDSVAAALVLAGLFLYNGLTTVAFVLWLSSALGAGLGAQ